MAGPVANVSEEEWRCLRELYKSDYSSEKYSVSRQGPLEGTCLWFLRHESYLSWRNSQHSKLLWISGVPGSGKSVLASFIIDQLQVVMPNESLPNTVIYFFFKDDSASSRKVTTAMCALLHQLFSVKTHLIKHAVPDFKKKEAKYTDEFRTLWNILLEAAADTDCGTITGVLDGIDECEEQDRKLLLESLRDFHSKQYRLINLKFIVTSRPIFSIELAFRGLATIRLKTEDEMTGVDSDIELVIKSKIKDIGSQKNLSATVLANLEEKLVKNADRTFLWVSLIFEIIKESPRANEMELEKITGEIPEELDQVYENVLKELKETRHEKDTWRLLQILIAAERPMTLTEINIAFAITPSDISFDDLCLEPSMETTVKALCGIFVRVMESKVHFVHHTARSFLLKDFEPAVSDPGERRHTFDIVECNYSLAAICISYLQLVEFGSNAFAIALRRGSDDSESDCPSEDVEHGNASGDKEDDDRGSFDNLFAKRAPQLITYRSFLDYAAKHWADHARKAQIVEKCDISERILDMCRPNTPRFEVWFPLHWATISSSPHPGKINDLLIASHFGLEAPTLTMLKRGAELEHQDGHYCTALHRAAARGHAGVVKILLDAGAQMEGKDCFGQTALHFAASGDHEAVVRLLADYGAQIDVKDNMSHLTPLHKASMRGHDGVARALLRLGADVDGRESNYTPLHLAVGRGHEHVVRVLVENNASIDKRSGEDFQNTALHFAAARGSVSIARLLLKLGAEIDAKGRYNQFGTVGYVGALDFSDIILELAELKCKPGHTPLHVAVIAGRRSVMSLLLKKGADPNTQDDSGKTALHWLSWKTELEYAEGNEIEAQDAQKPVPMATLSAMERLLLDKGGNPEAQEENGFTPLHLLSQKKLGGEALAHILLDYGADVNARNYSGNTALIMAAAVGNEKVLKLLLEKGGDPNLEGSSRWTALHRAAESGNIAKVQLLIKHGSKIDSREEYGRTPLHQAIMKRHEGTATALIQNGADVHDQDDEGRTAVHMASFLGYVDIVQLLIKLGASVHSLDKEGRTPLQMAAYPGQKEAVECLLRNGALIDATDEHGETALMLAANGGQLEVVKFLIEKGADTTVKDNDGKTIFDRPIKINNSKNIS